MLAIIMDKNIYRKALLVKSNFDFKRDGGENSDIKSIVKL